MTRKKPRKVLCQLRSLMRQWQATNDEDLTFRKLAKLTGKGERTLRRWASNDVGSYDADVLSAVCSFFEVGVEAVLALNGTAPASEA